MVHDVRARAWGVAAEASLTMVVCGGGVCGGGCGAGGIVRDVLHAQSHTIDGVPLDEYKRRLDPAQRDMATATAHRDAARSAKTIGACAGCLCVLVCACTIVLTRGDEMR